MERWLVLLSGAAKITKMRMTEIFFVFGWLKTIFFSFAGGLVLKEHKTSKICPKMIYSVKTVWRKDI